MADPYFLDTNILVYSFDPRVPKKRNIARTLIADAFPWEVSWQVVQEFCSVALHRFPVPLTHRYLENLIELLLAPHCTVYADGSLWQSALQIQEQSQYRFYDSLIVAAALRTGVPVLYSEDLQHGRRFGDLEIRNPFLDR